MLACGSSDGSISILSSSGLYSVLISFSESRFVSLHLTLQLTLLIILSLLRTSVIQDSTCINYCFANVWFQKISIPPPRRELEIPEGLGGGGGGQRPRKFRRGGGVVSEFTFPDGHV